MHKQDGNKQNKTQNSGHHAQQNNPLHGQSLEKILTALVAHYGWVELSHHIEINCFMRDPGIKSSLIFLRKTPWARNKVEALFVHMLSEQIGRASWRERGSQY